MKEPQTPQGTIALLLVYFLFIVALWANAYITMLSRGGDAMSEQHDQNLPDEVQTDEEVAEEDTSVEAVEDIVESTTEESGALHIDKYESLWIRLSILVLAVFLGTVIVSGFASGYQLPGVYQRVDPATLRDEGSPFANPEIRELAPGKYEVYTIAQMWAFSPAEIRIPVGSEITFYVTSQDVQHGFKVSDTNINMMVLPGHISTLRAKFDEPGTHNFVCHEYCGTGHHIMYGQLIVEAPAEEESAGEEQALAE